MFSVIKVLFRISHFLYDNVPNFTKINLVSNLKVKVQTLLDMSIKFNPLLYKNIIPNNGIFTVLMLHVCAIVVNQERKFPNINSIDLQIMNYLILFTKGFINRKKISKISNLFNRIIERTQIQN